MLLQTSTEIDLPQAVQVLGWIPFSLDPVVVWVSQKRRGRQQPYLDPIVYTPPGPTQDVGHGPRTDQGDLLTVDYSRDLAQIPNLFHRPMVQAA